MKRSKHDGKKLSAAVLRQALADIVGKNPGFRLSAYKWVKKFNATDHCSFYNVCLALDLEYQVMRDLILVKKLQTLPNIKILLRS